jgi:protein O-mannosyl-transferase
MRTYMSISKETAFSRTRSDCSVYLLLLVLIFFVFFQTRTHGFINYDDETYITSNPHVAQGLNVQNMIWAFSTSDASNWHPLTWISHMMDIQIYGVNPGAHHFTNMLFHIANSFLIFFLFRKMTCEFWKSCFLAVLFAIHPLHVESVAWVAERKDVLSTFFGLITLWGYVRYVKKPGIYRYGLILIFYSLSLMAKPMLVTLPFVLLLMDYWPLRRFDKDIPCEEKSQKRSYGLKLLVLRFSVEKLPMVIVAIGSCFITLQVQQKGGAVGAVTMFPLWDRVANALITYTTYIQKMFWPFDLAVIYPYPPSFTVHEIILAGIILVVVSISGFMAAKRFPYIIVGWLWYIGTLVPVIGLVQIGSQSMADRYTYSPLIGIFIIIIWGVSDLTACWVHGRKLVFFAIIFCLCMTISAYVQTGYWKDSIRLFQHALDVTSGNWIANNNLGCALSQKGHAHQAIPYFQEALRINPEYDDARYNLGLAFVARNRFNDAIIQFSRILVTRPEDKDVHIRLGRIYSLQKRFDKAIEHFTRAAEIDPDDAGVYNNIGVFYANQKDFRKAVFFFQKAITIKPDMPGVEKNLKKAREMLSDPIL